MRLNRLSMLGSRAGHWLAVFLVVASSAECADRRLKSQIAGKTAEEALRLPAVALLPFVARDALLLQSNPSYRDMTPQEAWGMLVRSDIEYASANKFLPMRPVVWNAKAKGCHSYYKNGTQYMAMLYGNLTLSVVVGRSGKFVEAWVYASLEDEARYSIDLMPENIRLAATRPEVVDSRQESLKEVMRAAAGGARWKAALIAGLGGMATRTERSRTDGTYQGYVGNQEYSGIYQSNTTRTVPDEDARQRTAASARAIMLEAERRVGQLERTALLRTTVFPGKSVDGSVYFRPDREATESVLQVVIGKVSFEFPVEW
jgi:hypothetical protein